jgi:hypothetical protein
LQLFQAYKTLPFAIQLAERIPPKFFISGDSAFIPGGDVIMTPGGTDAYNYFQSSNRMCVEMAFGEMVMMVCLFAATLHLCCCNAGVCVVDVQILLVMHCGFGACG